MFWHNLKYSLKILFRNKALLFWTFIFPIILGTFFKLAFSNIENSEELKTIDIAVIDSDNYQNNVIFKDALLELSKEPKLFNLKVTDLNNAKKMLEDNKISGYLTFEQGAVDITINRNGINETIVKYVVDEIQSESVIINDLVNRALSEENNKDKPINYEKIYQEALSISQDNAIKLNNISNSNLSYTMIEYYTLIAMSALYGALISMFIINKTNPTTDSVGKRVSVSSISKSSLIISGLLASYVVQLIGLATLFGYTIFALKVDYGSKILPVIFLGMIASFAGLSLGTFIASMLKTNENTKTGILISLTMLSCFLSGMMGITMKYIIDKYVPIINKINPASMITDGLYSLYYYNTLDRYYFNIISLIIFSLVLILISLNRLRRQKYDSI